MISYQSLEDTILRWSVIRPDVRAVRVVGSRALENGPVDQYSDLDLVIYTAHPAAYDKDSSWIDSLGEIWLSVRSRTGQGDREWLALFSGGVKADFVIAEAATDAKLAEMLEQSSYADVFRRGVRVLLDKNGGAPSRELHLSAPKSRKLPTAVEFESAVNLLILDVARAAKFVRRGDLWRGQQQVNGEVMQALLVLVEWHAGLTSAAANDIWYAGRFIEKWADPHIVATLPNLLAGYDEVELHRALNSIIDLTEWMAKGIAESLDQTFPKPGQARALSWIRELLA
jgi:aminoglycoside 6-adenylyltransferase